jgi:hypothetical protein
MEKYEGLDKIDKNLSRFCFDMRGVVLTGILNSNSRISSPVSITFIKKGGKRDTSKMKESVEKDKSEKGHLLNNKNKPKSKKK